MVAQYGLAASQLARLRKAKIKTVVCVDTVAASGGYMMACVANTICAAPFAFIGSIGVVAGVPNFSKVLRQHNVEYHHFTAGQYKTTVTALNEVTEEQKEKFQEELTAIHTAFIHHVQTFRPKLDVKSVATGEYWLATEALEKNLVDRICTSDEYLTNLTLDHLVIMVRKADEKRSKMELFLDLIGLSTRRLRANISSLKANFGLYLLHFISDIFGLSPYLSVPQRNSNLSVTNSQRNPLHYSAIDSKPEALLASPLASPVMYHK